VGIEVSGVGGGERWSEVLLNLSIFVGEVVRLLSCPYVLSDVCGCWL
jgi:hypothetical protein